MTKYTLRARFASRAPKKIKIITWIIRGIFISSIVALGLTVVLSAITLLLETDYIDLYIKYIMVAVTLFSVFTGSMYAANRAQTKGLIVGGCVGLIYAMIFIVIGSSWNREELLLFIILNKMAASVAAGLLGGLIGVNL